MCRFNGGTPSDSLGRKRLHAPTGSGSGPEESRPVVRATPLFLRSHVKNLWQVHTTTRGAVRNPRRPSPLGAEVTQTEDVNESHGFWLSRRM